MKIILDVDGVLADFVGGIERMLGVELDDWPVGSDIVKYVGMKPHEFWKMCDYEFWYSLNKTPFADDLVEHLAKFDHSNVCIITNPCLTEGCVMAKRNWLNNNFPMFKNILFGNARQFLADKDAVLIDDFPINCEKFRQHGGCYVLVKQPWNTSGEFNTIKDLKDDINQAARFIMSNNFSGNGLGCGCSNPHPRGRT